MVEPTETIVTWLHTTLAMINWWPRKATVRVPREYLVSLAMCFVLQSTSPCVVPMVKLIPTLVRCTQWIVVKWWPRNMKAFARDQNTFTCNICMTLLEYNGTSFIWNESWLQYNCSSMTVFRCEFQWEWERLDVQRVEIQVEDDRIWNSIFQQLYYQIGKQIIYT